jgi:hypothetical protein
MSVTVLMALVLTFMFMTAWVFEARHCPTLLNEIKKTKLQIYTEPQAVINILLAAVLFHRYFEITFRYNDVVITILNALSFKFRISLYSLSLFKCLRVQSQHKI